MGHVSVFFVLVREINGHPLLVLMKAETKHARGYVPLYRFLLSAVMFSCY
jgi:hypothetical protein